MSLHAILKRITFAEGFTFTGRVTPTHRGDLWMIRVEKPYNTDAVTGEPRHSVGRWFLTDRDELSVARTCLVAVKNFQEHECYEFLRLDGEQLFSPHEDEL